MISIVLLFLVIILALGIGLFFSYKSIQTSKESFDNILKVPQENIPDLRILNNQLQSIYLFMTLFYSNQTGKNIYTELLKNNNPPWYNSYVNNSLIGNTESIDIMQFLTENTYFYYTISYSDPSDPSTIQIDPSTIKYNIKDGNDFTNYIKSLYNTLIQHSTNQLNFATISNNYSSSTTQLVEIMYIMTFLPPALYNIYIMPFNEVIVKYSGAIDTYEDYIAFHQMYTCANQMNLSSTGLSDSNGELLPYENCIQLNPYENEYIQLFIKELLNIFKSPLYINMLESSYILFYKAMIYFSEKFGISPQYEDSYTYKLITRIPITSIPPSTAPATTMPATTIPITTPVYYSPFCAGTLFGGNNTNNNTNKFNGTFKAMTIIDITNKNSEIMTISRDTNTSGNFKFTKEGVYNVTINLTQYYGGNKGNQNTFAIRLLGRNNATNSDFIPNVSDIKVYGYSDGNGTAPEVKNNVGYFYNKIANSGASYTNLFQYNCTITVNSENVLNNDAFVFYVAAYDGAAIFGTPLYGTEMYNKTETGNPTFIVTKIS